METKTKNIACRLFKEQINLINQLPEQDRANVLYLAIMRAFNQFENQIENQIENAYISISSSISISVLDLLSKNIVFKEYSNNYGGKREEAGRKQAKKNQDANQVENQVEKTGQVDHQVDHQVEQFEDFWSLYTPIKTSDGFVAKGNKQLAQKAFIKALKGASYETIIRGLEQYLTFCRENNRYTKQASTWLNQRGWEDDYGDNQAIQAEGRRGGSSFLNAMRDILADDSIR